VNPQSPLEVKVTTRASKAGDVALVSVAGEVDLATTDRLTAALASHACAESAGVVLDLAQVTFIDSSGLRVVMVAVQDLDSKLAVVVSPESPVERLFKLAEVMARVPAFPSVEAALANLGVTAQ